MESPWTQEICLGKVDRKQQWQYLLCKKILYSYQSEEGHLQQYNKQPLKPCDQCGDVFFDPLRDIVT